MFKCRVCKTLHNIFFNAPLDYKSIDAFNKLLKYDNERLAPGKDLTKSSQFRAVVSGLAYVERAERLGLIGKTTATTTAKPQPEHAEPVSKPMAPEKPAMEFEQDNVVQKSRPFTREYDDPEFGPSVIKRRR
jgi:hypothetical protein